MSSKNSKSIAKSNPIFFKKVNEILDGDDFDYLDEMEKVSLLEAVQSTYNKFNTGMCSKAAQKKAIKELQQNSFKVP